MIKKIKVEQLEPGMYIHDMNCGWMDHPFMTNSLKVKNEKMIEKIIGNGIKDVYIDTEKGLDVDDAPTAEEVSQEIQEELNKMADLRSPEVRKASIKDELVKAREIKKEAKKAVYDIMEDVRFGKPLKADKVEKVVDKMIDSIFRNQDALISLARIKQTDEYTYMHSMGVCVLMISFSRHLGLNKGELKHAAVGAMLHDIGKMKVPLELLNKKSGLTDDEFEIIKTHVEHSRNLLKETKGIDELSVTLASQHHERLNGRGYPGGLKGDEISVFGKAAAIVDVYDAMTSQRCYQRKSEPTEVLRKLYEWKDSYSMELVQQFVRCIGIYPVGTVVRLDNGLLGVVLDHGKENLLQPLVRIVYDSQKSRQVMPYDLDLEERRENRVEGYEVPEKWGIRPEVYL